MQPAHRFRWIPAYCISFSFILIICELCSGPAYAQVPPQSLLEGKIVLVLHAFESNIPIFELTDRGLRTTLDAGGVGIRNQFFEYLDLARNPGPEYRKHLAELMRLRYGQRKIDVIITLYLAALQFALDEGETIFPEIPIIALYLPPGFEPQKAGRRIIRQTIELDMLGTLESALGLVSGAKHVYVVSGALDVDRKYEDQARRSFKKWEKQLEFRYLSDMPLEEILDTVSAAPPGTIVLLMGFGADVTGKNYTTREVGERLSRVSKAPVFGLLQVVLGYGIAGGNLVNFEYVGTRAGELTLDILRGTRAPENIPPILAVPSLPMFDWRQLKRWNLSEAALPEGSIVINRETTFWDFKYYILGGLALMIGQSLLIAGLMIQRRRRRLAEESLSRAEEKYRNIFDSALEGIYETSPQGQFLTANRALARMLGYDSPEEVISLIGDAANQVWADPNDRADYLRLLDEQNVIRGFECRFLRKDGTKFWVSLNTRRVSGPDGQTLFYSGFLEDITARKQDEEALKERLNFEMLMAEISALFVNLPADRIDSEIEAAQRRVCELLGLDRATLWQVPENEPGMLLLTHFHQPPGSLLPPARMSLKEFFPWTFKKVLGGEALTISKMTDLPAEAYKDRETFIHYDTKSNVIVPLSVGKNEVFGLLTFAVMHEERNWPETLVMRLKLIAQVFANALARRRTEQALLQRTEELDKFFSVTLDLLCIANFEGYFLRLNPAWEKVLSYSREELMARRLYDFVHPDDLAGTREAVSRLAAQREVIHFENRYRCKDGTYRWLEWTSAPAGELIYSAARDVTLRKQKEEALRERLQFEHLLSGLSARFVNMPPDQVDSEIEGGLKQILEFFQIDRCGLLRLLLDKTAFQITHVASSDDVPPVPEGVELPRSLYPWTYDILAENNEALSVSRLDDLPAEANVDRRTCIEWGIRSYVNIPILIRESINHIISINSVKGERVWPEELLPRLRLLGEIFVNALIRKEAEGEAMNARSELLRMERLSRMGELTSSLAHEINQPLSAIRTNAEAAQRFLSGVAPDIGEVRQILEDIIRDDRRANDVVQKVRALVRKEKPQEEILDLNKTIQEVVGLIRSEFLLQGLSFAMELSPDLKMIRGDRIQLQQVILNLILNSAAAMRNSPRAQRKITVKTAMPDSGTVKASVTDFGTGIDQNNIELLFEPFYTTKPDGLGMGLSISQRIITAHGGSLKASNNPQGGATFAFTLPAHPGDAP
jgi:PAS domain S-box-containing protein